jgi:Protein of unknown function (DUF1583)
MRLENHPCLASDGPIDAVDHIQSRIIASDPTHFGTSARVLSVVVFASLFNIAGLSLAQTTVVKAPSPSGSGRTVVIKVIEPGGEVLSGVTSYGLNGPGSSVLTPGKAIELVAIAPQKGKKRLVWFAHEGKKLAGAVTISGDSTGPYTAKLVPWAVVTGRVVDKDKKPRAGLVFHIQAGETSLMVDIDSFAHWSGPVGSDGLFRVERIVPGLMTTALIVEPAIHYGHRAPALKPKPGETIDLGTLVVPTVVLPAGAKNVLAPPPMELPLATFDESKANAQYRFDFRDGNYDLRWLRIDAPGGAARLVQPERRGLRFTVPAGQADGATVVTKFGVGGDFEITGTFEALSSVRPDIGWGMGPELLVKPAGGWDKFASAGRFLRTDTTVYSLVHGHKVGDEKKYDASTIPTDSKTGQFRLIRTGGTLHFQVAEGASSVFRERFATEFGTEPLEFVRLAAVTGGSQKLVDALWKDLTIRAEELPGFSAPGARPRNLARNLRWFGVSGLAVVAVAAIIWWRAGVRKRPPERVAKTPANRQETVKPALPDAWDEAALTRMEQAAAAFAEAHLGEHSCGQRPRFQFSLREGKLNGPFIAWKAVTEDELNTLGSSWDEIREKLPPLFVGSYRQGKRNGTFSYHDEQGRVSHRRYGDGRPIEVRRRGEMVNVRNGRKDRS